jgi:hypothetical protein
MKPILPLLFFVAGGQIAATTVSGPCSPFPVTSFSGGTIGTASVSCPAFFSPFSLPIDSVRLDYTVDWAFGAIGLDTVAVNFAPTNGIPSKTVVNSQSVPSIAGGPVTESTTLMITSKPTSIAAFNVNLTSAILNGSVGSVQAGVQVTFCFDVLSPSPACPVPPSFGSSGNWSFAGNSGMWYDPPITNGYDYTGTAGTTFTKIVLPGGFGPVTVLYGSGFGSSLGAFSSGSTVDFVSLTGGALNTFRITGISPSIDAGDPNAFPLQMYFAANNGSFNQDAVVPEASTFAMLLTGLAIATLSRRVMDTSQNRGHRVRI